MSNLSKRLRMWSGKASLDMSTTPDDSHYMSHDCPVADLVAAAQEAADTLDAMELQLADSIPLDAFQVVGSEKNGLAERG